MIEFWTKALEQMPALAVIAVLFILLFRGFLSLLKSHTEALNHTMSAGFQELKDELKESREDFRVFMNRLFALLDKLTNSDA